MAFTGALLRRGDEGYEAARVGSVFNARRPERWPAAVLLAADEDDVVAGMRLARDEGWRVSVRSGGHSWAAWSVRDDALLIDLGALREIAYDAATEVATANPAVRGGTELDPFLERHGRMFPGGHCESVGLGGFLLQGGQGWNSRRWGWGCENVLAVDVVTADGELVRADAERNSDLYWAARGAGPGFPGVVTRFHLRTHPRPAAMVQDTWTFALDDLEELLGWLHDVLPALDVIVEPVVAATRLFGDAAVLLLHTTAMCDSTQQADALLAPLAPPAGLAARALGHERGLTTIAQENAAQAIQNPEGHRYAVDCTWTDAGADDLAPVLRELWSGLPTEHSFSIWYGWAPTRTLPDMAFSIEANVYVATYVIYADDADDERYRSWVHEQTARLAAAGGAGRGVYLGDTDFTRRPDRFLADENFARLEAIRAARDPDGRICSYLIADGAQLNAAPARRPGTASGR
ncbi:MAG: linked oxidase protein [Conexibacter sp.]|nr:linked oxidase protein [Conexibacter sp.]